MRVPLSALLIPPDAPIDEAKVTALAEDMVRRGQQRPLSVINIGAGRWLVADGAHRTLALIRLAESEAWVLEA